MSPRSTIKLSFYDVGDYTARELDKMVRDDSELDCQIGPIHFKARMDRGEIVRKFLPAEGCVGYEFLMLAGTFKVDGSTMPLDESIETMCSTMGWIVRRSSVTDTARYVVADAISGHANVSDLIVALDSGLLPFKLRVTKANPAIELVAGGLVLEMLELRFGW